MKSRHKLYLRLNIMSLVFVVISFISVTLAWFAYSGIANLSTEIDVKAWYIELEKNGESVSNDIVISLSEIYPGMDIVNEVVSVRNLGDSDAQLKYSIVYARILDSEENNHVVDGEIITSEYVEDILSHDYPFHININLSRGYVLSKGGESSFEVSISWPLDSDSDALDSLWGTEAYKFYENERNKRIDDPSYVIRSPIQVSISITAEQYMETSISSDTRYNLNDRILFDVVNNEVCTAVGPTCIETYVMDVNNKIGDNIVTLLPNPNNIYLNGIYADYDSLLSTITSGWTVTTRPLLVEDLLKVISTDVMDSVLIRDELSDMIIGNLNYNNRINVEIIRAINYNGYYNFTNERFNNYSADNCYWTSSEYNSSNGFAIKKINENNSNIFGKAKVLECNVVPVILASKSNL